MSDVRDDNGGAGPPNPRRGRGAIILAVLWLAGVGAVLVFLDRQEADDPAQTNLQPQPWRQRVSWRGGPPAPAPAEEQARRRNILEAVERVGDWPAALRQLDILMKADPSDLTLLRKRAHAYAALEQWNKAAKDFDTLAAGRPLDFHESEERGEVEQGLGRWRESANAFTRAIAVGPLDRADALMGRGFAYSCLGEWAHAEADFAEAVRRQPSQSFTARFYQAYLRLRDGDGPGYRKVSAELLKRASGDPGTNDAPFGLWVCILRPPADAAAVLAVAEASAAGRHGFIRRGVLGAAFLRAGQPERGVTELEEARRALEGEPRLSGLAQHAYYGYLLALAHARLGHVALARREFDRASRWQDEAQHLKPGPPGRAGRFYWHQELTLRLLRSEAERALRPTI